MSTMKQARKAFANRSCVETAEYARVELDKEQIRAGVEAKLVRVKSRLRTRNPLGDSFKTWVRENKVSGSPKLDKILGANTKKGRAA